jgi:hypothetical protein
VRRWTTEGHDRVRLYYARGHVVARVGRLRLDRVPPCAPLLATIGDAP